MVGMQNVSQPEYRRKNTDMDILTSYWVCFRCAIEDLIVIMRTNNIAQNPPFLSGDIIPFRMRKNIVRSHCCMSLVEIAGFTGIMIARRSR